MEYENQRLKTIEENKRKMHELGIKAHAYEVNCLMDQKRRKFHKMKSDEVIARDVEYIPDKGYEVDLSSEEDDNEDDDNAIAQNVRSLRSHSKKVIASRENPMKSSKKPNCSTISMSSMLKMRSQACKNQEQQRKGKKVLTSAVQQETSKENGRLPSQAKSQQRVSVVAPGSLNSYLRLKKKPREELLNQTYASGKDSIQIRSDLSPDHQMENSQKQRADFSLGNSVHGLVDEDEDIEISDDDRFEEEKVVDAEEIENDMVELISTEGNLTDQPVLQKQKRTRGPSLCQDVHNRLIDERKPIILNELGQPIGPSSSTLDEFSRFLGTLARDSNLVPLNKLDWHHVSNKDGIWNYVKQKYLIAEEGKSYVLRSVGVLWRNYKCRIKTKHYKAYDNMRDRWKNRPTLVPKSHFKDLLKFWSLKHVQQISEKNKVTSESQMDRHTAGPVSFARKQHELEQASNMPPSKATLYKETRKRKPEKNYKTSYELIDCNIKEGIQAQEHRTLSGRCTKRLKKPSKTGMLIPDEFLQPYRAHIVKDTVDEVMKILQRALPSDMLASITPSIIDPSNNLLNKQSYQYQNDGASDAEANDRNDLERNDERCEEQEQDED